MSPVEYLARYLCACKYGDKGYDNMGEIGQSFFHNDARALFAHLAEMEIPQELVDVAHLSICNKPNHTGYWLGDFFKEMCAAAAREDER